MKLPTLRDRVRNGSLIMLIMGRLRRHPPVPALAAN